jgi:hypothetical protein
LEHRHQVRLDPAPRLLPGRLFRDPQVASTATLTVLSTAWRLTVSGAPPDSLKIVRFTFRGPGSPTAPGAGLGHNVKPERTTKPADEHPGPQGSTWPEQGRPGLFETAEFFRSCRPNFLGGPPPGPTPPRWPGPVRSAS